jgi:hypothetical protein
MDQSEKENYNYLYQQFVKLENKIFKLNNLTYFFYIV